ncbi:cation/H(+) antiporter 15-like [Arachis ipaensis]|nr:cation/H(+) antiporter 15-like [Arachis ipaensis]XP_025652054.1 cation/H(+) antiporter 15-like [Arachis hypogaea]
MAGLEMNLDFVLRAPKKPRIIAICSTLIPMILGIGIYSLVPVLANILVDLKLLYTRLGKLALTVATHNDFYNWIMFALVFPFLVNGYRAIFSMPCVIAFILLSHFVLRPLLEKIVAKKPNKHDWTNYQLSFVIMGLFACTGLTDVLGVNPLVGALIYGLAIPRGSFTEMLMERSDDFGSRYLAPLFFFSGGLRCNVVKILQTVDLDFVVIVILSIFTKMVTTFADCRFGFCCYSDLVYLHKDGYNICSYSLLWPKTAYRMNMLRTIQNLGFQTEVRILVCVHNPHHASGMVNILEALSGISVSSLRVTAIQLVELKGRVTSLVSVQLEHQSSLGFSQSQSQSSKDMETIASHFHFFAQVHSGNHAETSMIMSPFATINRDIYNLAMEKQTSLVLLPFRKHWSSDSNLEVTKEVFGEINQNVMKDAPCSVGLFIDRGLNSLLNANLHIIMLFIGGPHDREALAIAWRMAGQHRIRIQLTMVRIILCGKAAMEDQKKESGHEELLSAVLDKNKERELDDSRVNNFRIMGVNNKDTIKYEERYVESDDDIPRVVNEFDQKRYDLYVLGQGKGRHSRVLSEMLDWTDFPEPGVIGDLVASNSFGSYSSVHVIQKYGYGGMEFGKNYENNRSCHPPICKPPSMTRSLSRMF